MTTRTSTRTQRVEVITRGERRRRWSIEEKREIVAESLQPGIGPSEIILKHGISSGQLYTWRQQLACRLVSEPAGSSANSLASMWLWRSGRRWPHWWLTSRPQR